MAERDGESSSAAALAAHLGLDIDSIEERIWKVPEKWLKDKEFLEKSTPSRLYSPSMSYEMENTWIQILCYLIEDLGWKVEVSQLVINTAIVYLRRFFLSTPLQLFNREKPMLQVVAATCLFLAAKVEEKPRKLEHIINWKLRLSGSHLTHLTDKHENREFIDGADDYKRTETALLKKLGFDLTVDHPHTHVVKACQNFKAQTAFAQTAYFMATCSLQMTPMCLMFSASEVAVACIHLAMKWSRLHVLSSVDGEEWYKSINNNLTQERLNAIADVLVKAFRNNETMIQKILNPQKTGVMKVLECYKQYRAEMGQKRAHIYGFFTEQNASLPRVIATPIQPGSSRSPGSSQSRSSSQEPQPGPCGLSGSSSTRSRSSSSGLQPGKPQEQCMRKGEQQSLSKLVGVAVEVPGCRATTASTSASHTSTHSSMQPPVVTASVKPSSQGSSRPEQQSSHTSTSRGASASATSATKRLSLLDYQQRADQQQRAERHRTEQQRAEQQRGEQRTSHVAQAKAEAQLYPMHPVAAKQAHPAHLKASSGRPYPQGHAEPKKPLPSANQQVKGAVQSQPMPISHGTVVSEPTRREVVSEAGPTPMDWSYSSSQDRNGRQQRPLAKPVKKEGPMGSVNNMHLKEAKVMVQDLKDAQGKDKALYNNAEASRKRTFSQTLEDGDASQQTPGKSGDNSQMKYLKLSQDKAPYNHSGDASHHVTPMEISQDQRRGIKRRSPSGPVSAPTTPIKLSIKRDAGKLHVQNHESPPKPATKSSPLKMKIRRAPDASSMELVSSDAEEGLKMRLAVPGSGSGHLDKHSHSSARASTSAEGYDRRQKHGSYGQNPALLHSVSKPGSRSSTYTPQMAGPLPHAGDAGLQHRLHTRPTLQTQSSGYTFQDVITQQVPDMIFEPETPTDQNGGFGAPETPTADNASRVAAHMNHLFAQTHLSQSIHPPPQPFFNITLPNSRDGTLPPLPPPLPENPPPPPPPPPQ